MDTERIYLAGPFYSENAHVRWQRYEAITKYTAELMRSGNIVFSPVTHSYYLAEKYGCPQSPGFWERWYVTFLEHWATILYVLKLPGWENSNGVAKEIKMAKILNMPIEFVDYQE